MKLLRKRRWIKAVLPVAVVLAGTTATLIVHAVEQPDHSDPSYLSPISDAPDGAKGLADRLQAEGIVVDRRTRTPEAIAAVTSAPASILFVPVPEMVHPTYLADLKIVPPSVRVVLVEPSALVVRDAGFTTPVSGPRWTAAATHSGCGEQFAARPAAVLRWQYGDDDSLFSCYQGGVVEVERGGPTVTMVGASDPFRNDRRREWSNADFATGLLSRGERVVWLDLHEREQLPPGTPLPKPTKTHDDQNGDDGSSGGGDSGRGDGQNENGDPQAGGGQQQSQDNPLFDAFPPAFWATLLLLVLALLALAAASARRLGAPVPEPLPARVRAAETVRGLGGLYRRARARDASLTTIQDAAVRRLAAQLGLPPDSTVQDLPEHMRDVLTGTAETDEELVARTQAIQKLVDEGDQL